MTDTAFAVVQYQDTLGIRTRRPHPQEIRVRPSDLPARNRRNHRRCAPATRRAPLLSIKSSPPPSASSARAESAERRRQFRQRRRARQRGAHSSVKETTPA